MPNIVDFHIHGIGSKYKDAFATASYDHICAYFQRLASKRKRNVIVAFTEHDCSVITFDQYKELQKKYPNVKIMLGMEANAKLTHATDGVFEVAHILAYADMSSDESVKKWLDCQELKDLSKIKTFQIHRQVPSNEAIVTQFCGLLNFQYGLNIDVNEIVKEFGKSKLRSFDLKNKVVNYVAEKIFENKNFAFADCKTVTEVASKLKTINLFVNKNPNMLSGLVPSQYSFKRRANVELAIKKLEALVGKKINREEFNKQLNYGLYNSDFDRQFATAAAKIIQQDKALLKKMNVKKHMKAKIPGPINPEYVQSYISSQILKNAKYNSKVQKISEMFNSDISTENFGDKLYIAKSILNKNIGTKITNREIAALLDSARSREVLREHFVELVRFSLKYNNPTLYKRVEKLSVEDFAKFTLGTNDHGIIALNILVPSSPNKNHNITTDIRTPLAEINQIVKKTGGHLVLAHPDLKFDFSKGKAIPAYAFEDDDKDLVSNSKYREIERDLLANGEVSTSKLLGDKEKILKMELFFRLCKKNGINFDGFEIRKANLSENRELFRNYLIYAAKNGYETSFGSDSHFSNMHFYNDLLFDKRISQAEFNRLAAYADEIGDDTAKTGRHKIYYPTIFTTRENNINFARKRPVGPILKNDCGKLYNNNYIVEQTSFCDKLLGKNNLASKPLLTLKYNNNVYYFDRDDLSRMNYNFGDHGENFGGNDGMTSSHSIVASSKSTAPKKEYKEEEMTM